VPLPRPDTVRLRLVEQAAALLAGPEPVTLRRVAAAAGTSTMAVYTHFGGMPGLWQAVRQEGFTRLAAALAGLAPSPDPVADLMRIASAYTANAMGAPALYRAMFDAARDLADSDAADAPFALLADAVGRAVDAGRFDADTEPQVVATRMWVQAHGLVILAVTGVLDPQAIDEHLPALGTAIFVACGDTPEDAAASVAAGWTPPEAESRSSPTPRCIGGSSTNASARYWGQRSACEPVWSIPGTPISAGLVHGSAGPFHLPRAGG